MQQYEWDQYLNMSENDILREMVSEELTALESRRGKAASRKQTKSIMIDTIALAVLTGYFCILPPDTRGFLLPISLVVVFLLSGFAQAMLKSDGIGCGCITLILPWMLISVLGGGLEMPPLATTILGILIFIILYGFFIRRERKVGLVDRLADEAKAAPDKDIHSIVCESEDLYFVEEEKPWTASKGLIAGLLALSLVLSGFGIASCFSKSMTGDNSVELANSAPEANYEWEYTANGYCLIDFDAGTREVNPTIPSHIDGVPVVAIANRAFQNETRVTSIVLPDTVTEIGSYAFKGCTNLKTVTMGDQVTSIGGEAFYGCSSLMEFTVPRSVTEIRGNTFQNCTALQTVRLHDGITAIHAYAFHSCRNLTSISLPAGITEIRANTFEYCVSLREIVIPDGVTRIAAHAFYGCTSLSDVTVPMTVNEIGSSAFRECSALKHIILPEGCAVNERAFKDSPTQVEYIYPFTPEQEAAIREEVELSNVDVLYYLYAIRDGETLLYIPNDDGYVFISNNPYYLNTVIADKTDLFYRKLTDNQAVLDYLKQAKELGATQICYEAHSEIASEITDRFYVVSVDLDIDDMIVRLEAGLGES